MDPVMVGLNPDYPTPSAQLCAIWIREGWKHGYQHAFKLASDWGYQQSKEEDSTVLR